MGNSAYLGLPVPDKIKSVLHQLHDRDVKEDSTNEDNKGFCVSTNAVLANTKLCFIISAKKKVFI